MGHEHEQEHGTAGSKETMEMLYYYCMHLHDARQGEVRVSNLKSTRAKVSMAE